MKMKHRKLFPNLTATNQTDCPDFCDPSCPYNCNPYDDFYFIPPPPPPPPPPTSEGQQVFPYVIIIVSSLAGFLLLVASYVIIVKYFSCWNPLRREAPTQSDGQDEDLVGENIGPAIDHPIWYINTIGLQPSVINSITIFKYKKGDPLIEGRECSVCLTEFQEDETLRLLPKCNHAFHIPCIDTWLRSHTNCPLCRAAILSNTWSVSLPSPSNEQSSFNLAQNEETQMENLGNNELGGHSEICENRVETENELVEVPRVDDERKELDDSKNRVNSNGNCIYSVLSGLEYKDVGVDDIQPVRRSASMDSSSFSTITFSVDSFCMAESGENLVNQRENLQNLNFGVVEIQDCANSKMNRVIGSPSIAQSLRKSPVSMKRSFSCGASLFLSRYSRNSSSILPL